MRVDRAELPVCFIPREHLAVGMRVWRFEWCEVCKQLTAQLFELLSVSPLVWGYTCATHTNAEEDE